MALKNSLDLTSPIESHLYGLGKVNSIPVLTSLIKMKEEEKKIAEVSEKHVTKSQSFLEGILG